MVRSAEYQIVARTIDVCTAESRAPVRALRRIVADARRHSAPRRDTTSITVEKNAAAAEQTYIESKYVTVMT